MIDLKTMSIALEYCRIFGVIQQWYRYSRSDEKVSVALVEDSGSRVILEWELVPEFLAKKISASRVPDKKMGEWAILLGLMEKMSEHVRWWEVEP